MKRIAYLSAVLAVLVFSGCSSKEPAIDATANASASGNGSNGGASGAQTSGTDGSAVISPVTNASSADNGAAGANASNAQLVNILFNYDKFDIREDMVAAVKANAALLKNKTFKLEGNCDEFGSDEYNFALGLKRANAVKTALVNEGINADSISMTSLGEGNPTCTEKTQECWAKNRRVEVKLP